jgi:peptidoglycan/xylan/chitin deacetylase (PgdA/CDA1 family)
MFVTEGTLRNHVAFLNEKFNIISLAELVERMKGGKSVSGCCAITFDDGWHDNFTHAYPIMLDFQVPATVFLATAFIGTTRMFWPEELTYYLGQKDSLAASWQMGLLNQFINEIPVSITSDGFLDSAIETLKNWSPQKREELLDELRSSCLTPPSDRLLMNWEEVVKMRASGLISFGAHTANHVILDQVSLREAEEEIIQSRQELEDRLGAGSVLFSFPNGNYTSDLQAILERNGFKGAVTTRKGWVDKSVGLFEIPRVGMHEDVSCTRALFWSRILFKRF